MKNVFGSLLIAVVSIIVFASCRDSRDSGVLTESNASLSRPPVKWKIKESVIRGGKDFGALYFTDAQTGFAGAAGRLYKTTDSGATWKETVVEFLPNSVVKDIAFFDTSNGLMIATTDSADPGQRAEITSTIYGTKDGGDTWLAVYSGDSLDIRDLKIAGRVAWMTGSGLFRYSDKFEDLSAWKDRYDSANARAVDCYKSAGTILEATETNLRVITSDGAICRVSENGVEAEPGSIQPPIFAHIFSRYGLTTDGKIWVIRGSGLRHHGIFSNLRIDNEFSSDSPQDAVFDSAIHLHGRTFVVSGQEVAIYDDKKKGPQGEKRTAVIWTTYDDGKTWTEIFRKPGADWFTSFQLIDGEKRSIRAMNRSGEFVSLFEE